MSNAVAAREVSRTGVGHGILGWEWFFYVLYPGVLYVEEGLAGSDKEMILTSQRSQQCPEALEQEDMFHNDREVLSRLFAHLVFHRSHNVHNSVP
jgi:hypothetical protein